MTTNTEILTAVAELKVKMDTLDEKVDRLEEKVIGNGRPGILVDQILQSEKISQLLVYAKDNADGIKTLKEVTPSRWLSRNWYKITIFLILFFVVVHSVLPEVSIVQLLGMLK